MKDIGSEVTKCCERFSQRITYFRLYYRESFLSLRELLNFYFKNHASIRIKSEKNNF